MAPCTEPMNELVSDEMMPSAVRSPVSGDACCVDGSYAVRPSIVVFTWFAASMTALTLAAMPVSSRLTVIVMGPVESVVFESRLTVTPGSNPLTVLVADVTVYAPGPVPTVSCASAASVSVTKPPTFALNPAASTFSPLFAPAVFAVSWKRYEFAPTCTAVAVTPAFAPLMFATTVARLPSPVLDVVAR